MCIFKNPKIVVCIFKKIKCIRVYIIKDLTSCDGTINPKNQYVVLTKATPLGVYIIPIFPKKWQILKLTLVKLMEKSKASQEKMSFSSDCV